MRGVLQRFARSREFHTPWPNRPRLEVLTYLDDKEHKKVFPSDRSRRLPSAHVVRSSPLPRFRAPICDPIFHWRALRFHRSCHGLGLERVSSEVNQELFNPWSASKFLSIAFAAQSLRESGLGLHTTVKGLALGDLVSLVCCYDKSRAYGRVEINSNSVANYFHSLIGPDSPTTLLQKRLGLSSKHCFETTYQTSWRQDPALPLPRGLKTARGRKGGYKKMSLEALTEGLRFCLSELHPDDLEILLYGASESQWYPETFAGARTEMGGLSSDPSIYFQSALNISEVERNSRGRWRIFSKSGFGPATSDRDNEFVIAGYLYLPVFEENDESVSDHSREFIVAARLDGRGLPDSQADEIFAKNLKRLVESL